MNQKNAGLQVGNVLEFTVQVDGVTEQMSLGVVERSSKQERKAKHDIQQHFYRSSKNSAGASTDLPITASASWGGPPTHSCCFAFRQSLEFR
eukprot:12184924-Karenia_brevis.AAC.1